MIVTMTIWTPDLKDRTVPRYQAIAGALAEDIERGVLATGDRLPTHRELARRLGVTVGTVTRAYAEAERRGLISGEVGRGSFVRAGRFCEPAASAATMPAGRSFGEPEGEGGAVIDLGLSVPPTPAHEEERRVLAGGLAMLAARPDLPALLRVQPYAGSWRHREVGARWIRRLELEVRPEEVLVTVGAQHAMAALFAALCEPGEVVYTEELTYPGIKSLAQLLHLRLVGVAMDEQGLRPDALEEACRQGEGRLLYTIPTSQNPTGTIMPEPRRRQIATIARRRGLTIVEDDVFGFVPSDRPPPLSVFARKHSYYMTSTSKLMAPGLRIGFLAAPQEMVGRLGAAVFSTAWMAPPAMAELVSVWIEDGTAERFAAWRRTDAMEKGHLARQTLGAARCRSHPQSLHLWLELPERWRAEEYAAQVRSRGVAVTPAEVFTVDRGRAPAAVRICPAAEPDRGRLDRALRILAEVLDQGPEPTCGIV
jgi:DNA-binding transcriptional MocR family regulator